MSDGGKGSVRRPSQIAAEEFEKRWEAIFGKNRHSTQEEKQAIQDVYEQIEQDERKSNAHY